MTEIGRLFYENPNGDHKAELELCADIDDRKRRIASMQGDLSSLKGVRICGKCGARFDESILLVSAATAAQSWTKGNDETERTAASWGVLFFVRRKKKWNRCFLLTGAVFL
ncbi:MAG: hypothetical protein ACLT3Y_05635 [Ruminococcus callidus]